MPAGGLYDIRSCNTVHGGFRRVCGFFRSIFMPTLTSGRLTILVNATDLFSDQDHQLGHRCDPQVTIDRLDITLSALSRRFNKPRSLMYISR